MMLQVVVFLTPIWEVWIKFPSLAAASAVLGMWEANQQVKVCFILSLLHKFQRVFKYFFH